MAVFVFFICCICWYIKLNRKNNSNGDSNVEEYEKDLEKGKWAKRTANHYARYVKESKNIYACQGDLESGFDESYSSSGHDFYDVKFKQAGFAKDATTSNVSQGEGKTNHDRQPEDAKFAKDNIKSNSFQGDQE